MTHTTTVHGLTAVADFLARGGRDTVVIGPLERSGDVLIAKLSTSTSVLDFVKVHDDADRDELVRLLRERFRTVHDAENHLQAARYCAEYVMTKH
jgi:hypothetical protein